MVLRSPIPRMLQCYASPHPVPSPINETVLLRAGTYYTRESLCSILRYATEARTLDLSHLPVVRLALLLQGYFEWRSLVTVL